jgi:uncharacterized protein (DUF302 family)
VGLVLPCKIIIYKDIDKTVISLFRPTESIKTLGFSDLKELAQDVEHHLKEAIDATA